jgi:hypothetical protein
VKYLRARLIKALENPTQHDPVYKVCQRFFQKTDDLTLTRDNPVRRAIRRSAYRRLLHGCPPGKRGDTSYGDAFNWEWMVRCADEKQSALVIVSRDSDYGITIENKSYVNDHLRHEFSDRVSRKRQLTLHSSLSEALRSFDVPASKKEEEAEKDLVSTPVSNLDIIDSYVRSMAFDKPNLDVLNAYLRSLNLDKTNWNTIAASLANAQPSPRPKSEEDKDKENSKEQGDTRAAVTVQAKRTIKGGWPTPP